MYTFSVWGIFPSTRGNLPSHDVFKNWHGSYFRQTSIRTLYTPKNHSGMSKWVSVMSTWVSGMSKWVSCALFKKKWAFKKPQKMTQQKKVWCKLAYSIASCAHLYFIRQQRKKGKPAKIVMYATYGCQEERAIPLAIIPKILKNIGKSKYAKKDAKKCTFSQNFHDG